MDQGGSEAKVRIPLLVDVDVAKALSDDVRILILDMLSQKPMSVQEIYDELRKRGYDKNINTVRYHLKMLKKAGLISLYALKEKRGGVLKYYASNAKVIAAEGEEEVRNLLEPLSEDIEPLVKDLILKILSQRKEIIRETVSKLKPCPYCITSHFVEYVIMKSLEIALGRAFEDERVRRILVDIASNSHE